MRQSANAQTWTSSSAIITSGFGGLAAALFFSSLIHALVIVIPLFDKTSDRVSEAPVRQPALSVTLNRQLADQRPRSVTAKTPRSRLDPWRGASEVSETGGNTMSPTMSPAEGLNLLPFPDMDYYATNALTTKPQPLGEAVLDPAEIAAIVVTGKLVLLLRINDQGEVVDVSVEHSDLPDVFSETAAKAFRKLPFAPGELDGRKVGAVMRVEVRYDDDRLPAP